MPHASPVGPAPTTTASDMSFTALLSTVAVDILQSAPAERCGLRSARFGHVGPSAALAADGRCDSPGEFAGVHLRRQILRHGGDDGDVANRQRYASTTMPVFHLLRSESASSRNLRAVEAIDARRQHLHALSVRADRFQTPRPAHAQAWS